MEELFFCISRSVTQNYFKRIRRSTNILLRGLNEELAAIKISMEEDGVELRFKPFGVFEKDNDDLIEKDREVIYAAIDKVFRKSSQVLYRIN